MVRPGLKRLQEAQRVKVQPNKTGTSTMLGRAVFLNRSGRNVVFNSAPDTPYSNIAFTKDVEHEYTAEQKMKDNLCKCIKKTVYKRDGDGNIIPSK